MLDGHTNYLEGLCDVYLWDISRIGQGLLLGQAHSSEPLTLFTLMVKCELLLRGRYQNCVLPISHKISFRKVSTRL